MKLIGIAGAAGAGKTTAADYLMEHYGFAQYSFAQPLKAGLAAMLGLEDPAQLEELKDEPLFEVEDECPTVRVALQTLGTEWAREMIRDDFWLLLATKMWQDLGENPSPFIQGLVIGDVRFENEAEWILQNGGQIVYIDCAKPHRDAPVHASEMHSILRDQASYTVDNNGSYGEYEQALYRLASQLGLE